MTLLGLFFDKDLKLIPNLKVEDKYMFRIAGGSDFSYSATIPEGEFYLRMRFSGKYFIGVRMIQRSFAQEIWYRGSPLLDQSGAIVAMDIFNTYSDKIQDLISAHKGAFSEFEKQTDKKFK